MASKNDVIWFLMHTAIKWNIRRISDPSANRNIFFRREAGKYRFTARDGVLDVVKSMLSEPDKAAWAFDQNFYCILGQSSSPDSEPINDKVMELFNDKLADKIRHATS